MKAKEKADKNFDTVKTFREIKTKISNDIKDMTFEELAAYLNKTKLRSKIKFITPIHRHNDTKTKIGNGIYSNAIKPLHNFNNVPCLQYHMKEISASKFRKHFSDVINKVTNGEEFAITNERNKEIIGYITPIS